MVAKTTTPIPNAHQLAWPRCRTTSATRCTVDPDPEGSAKRSGSWCTMMITPTPARNPVLMGAERKSAIHPSFSNPTSATSTPTVTASNDTRAMKCADPRGAMWAIPAANNGAMVESAPTDT